MSSEWGGSGSMGCLRGIALALVLALTAMRAGADGFRNPPAGADALGNAGANIVFGDDASAISQNPANLADLDSPQALASLTLLNSKAEYTSPLGISAETEDSWKYLPNLYFAMPVLQNKLVAGVGVTTPFGQSTEWSEEGILRYAAPYFAELKLFDVTPCLAGRINDKLSFGIGADLFWADLNMKQIYPWSTVTGNPATPDGEAEFSADGQGFGGNVALSWQVTQRQKAALTYRSAVNVDFEGDLDLSQIPTAELPAMMQLMVAPRNDFSTEITFPAVAAFGYGLQATKDLRVEADVEWIEFSSYDDLPLDVGAAGALLPTTSIREDWEDSWTFSLGADWQFSKEFVFRAGYAFIQSPIPDDTFSPLLPDADRHVLSLGLGYERKGHSLDLAYAFTLFDDRDISGNDNPAYDGTYEITSALAGISYSFSF
jgi:long-chain fatty acid transport protein